MIRFSVFSSHALRWEHRRQRRQQQQQQQQQQQCRERATTSWLQCYTTCSTAHSWLILSDPGIRHRGQSWACGLLLSAVCVSCCAAAVLCCCYRQRQQQQKQQCHSRRQPRGQQYVPNWCCLISCCLPMTCATHTLLVSSLLCLLWS